MKWFYNLSVQKKLLSGFLAVVALCGLLGAMSLLQASRMNDVTQDINGNWLPCVKVVGDIGL